MKIKRLCVVTMIGPFDLIGDLGEIDEHTGLATLERPCMIHPQQGSNMILRDMTRGSTVIQGRVIEINMRSVLWISEPTQGLCSAYQAHRSGILAPAAVKNNIQIDQTTIQ